MARDNNAQHSINLGNGVASVTYRFCSSGEQAITLALPKVTNGTEQREKEEKEEEGR